MSFHYPKSAHSPPPRRGKKNNKTEPPEEGRESNNGREQGRKDNNRERRARVHPNGQALIAIRDANTVYSELGLSPPVFVRCGALRDATWDTMVTPAQVRSALRQVEKEDTEGAWELLHEIDTQWGCMPQGGALEGYGSD